MHIGIQRDLLEAGKIMLQLPGIDFLGSVNHLPVQQALQKQEPRQI